MEPISYLEQRIAELQSQLQAIKHKIDEAVADQNTVEADLEGYLRALEAEKRLKGITPESPWIFKAPASAPKATPDGNKAEFARQFIRSRPNGVAPGQIYDAFIEAGIHIAKAYVYALVQRLRAQGVIKQRRGKWYPVVEEAQPVNGTGEVLP